MGEAVSIDTAFQSWAAFLYAAAHYSQRERFEMVHFLYLDEILAYRSLGYG